MIPLQTEITSVFYFFVRYICQSACVCSSQKTNVASKFMLNIQQCTVHTNQYSMPYNTLGWLFIVSNFHF